MPWDGDAPDGLLCVGIEVVTHAESESAAFSWLLAKVEVLNAGMAQPVSTSSPTVPPKAVKAKVQEPDDTDKDLLKERRAEPSVSSIRPQKTPPACHPGVSA